MFGFRKKKNNKANTSKKNENLNENSNFINRNDLIHNLKLEFSDNKVILDKILNIIEYTQTSGKKKETTENITKNDEKNDNKLSVGMMTQNLRKLIGKNPSENFGQIKGNEFVDLLSDYITSNSYDFKRLNLSHDDMFHILLKLMKEKKNGQFIIFLDVCMTHKYDINHIPKTGSWSDMDECLMHMAIDGGNTSLVNYLVKNHKDRIDFEMRDFVDMTFYDRCIARGKYNMASLIMSASLGINLSNSIAKYSENNEEINSISKLFLVYLKKNCHMNNTLDMVMTILEKTLYDLINNKKCFSKFLLKIVFDFNLGKNKSSVLNVKTNKLWKVIKNKLSEILDINTLYYEKVDWYWFKNYLLNSNIWLLKTNNKNNLLYQELLDIVKIELNKQKNTLKQEMIKLISNNKSTWNNICNFSYNNSKYSENRQDIIKNGLKNSYNKQDLNTIFINSSSKFDVFSLTDYSNYLSKLIILGHQLNDLFVNSTKNILNDYIKANKCHFKSGPVKTLERCKTKSQLDYNTSKYPTSACVIDIIRGSVTYHNLLDYYSSVQHFMNTIKNGKGESIVDILRIKNGFNTKYKKYLKSNEESKENDTDYFVPTGYLDIKMNLIISSGNSSIVGELQFLLEPMLQNKRQNHELYEITRLNDIIKHSNNNTKNRDINNSLQIAISGKNKREIAKIITLNKGNEIDVNKIGNDLAKTPLFLQAIKNNTLVPLLIKYFGNTINYELCDKHKNSAFHYISKYCSINNETNKQSVNLLLNALIEKDKVNLSHLKKFINGQNRHGRSPFTQSLDSRNMFVFNIYLKMMNKYKNVSLIDVNLVDTLKFNLFDDIFLRCNFATANLDILTFKKFENDLNNENKFYKMIFEREDVNSNKKTPFMYLMVNETNNNNNSLEITKYLLNKFKNKIIENDYKVLTKIKDVHNRSVIDLVKELDNSNKIKVLIKSMFNNLF